MSDRRHFFDMLVLGNCAFFLSGAITTMFMTPGADALEGNAFGRATMGISYLAVAVMLVYYRREALVVFRRNRSLVALVALGFASSLWAETPELSFRRCGAAAGATLLGVALSIKLTLEEQLRFMSWLFRILAILSLGCVLLFPSYGISHTPEAEWQGVFGFKNFFGSLMAISILIEYQLPTNTSWSKALNRAALLLSMFLLVRSDSMTSLLGIVVTFALVETYKFATLRLRMPLYATVVASLLIILLGFLLVAPRSGALARVFGRSTNLTGRTELWPLVISFAQERPILGYGYAGFWTESASKKVDSAVDVEVMYSHNGFLDILLTNGALGLSLAVIFLGTGLKRAFDWSVHGESRTELWPVAFLSFFLFYNVAECSIFMQHMLWALCVATVVGSDLALFAPETVSEDPWQWTTSEAFR